ncbi:MAG TPA: glutamate mutase L [Anaerolineaceae bacterium]|nr:glutamate mutase L [Anaerolineaceae bacterium]
MTTSLVDADTLLAIDIGAVNTRALLFDVVDGQYHFIAAGNAPTTADAPYKDISEGVRLAVERLQEITGRIFIGGDDHLVIPSKADGTGVDVLVNMISAGPAINMVVVGLLTDVSLESAQRLASSTYSRLAECIGLNDRRKSETQIDAIIRAQPDVIILAGGTENGATRSVSKLLEIVGLACYLIPQERRPTVLYAGNQALADKVKASLEGIAPVQFAPNIRPSIEVEDLSPAQQTLGEIIEQVRDRQVGGARAMGSLSGRKVLSTAQAFGRFVRFLSRNVNDASKGVLGIDLGGTSTVVAAAFGGRLNLSVYRVGVGEGMTGLLAEGGLEEITQWLPMHVPDGMVCDYLEHKALFPASLPVTGEENAIEQAAARQIIRFAVKNVVTPRSFGASMSGSGLAGTGLNVPFEPILAAGSILTHAPTPGQSLMMLLDGLQPIGVTTLLLDQNGLISAFGAVSDINSLLPVQVFFGSGAVLNLGTVISPVSEARYGTPILRVRLVREDNSETRLEVKQGAFHVLPLPRGQSAQLFLEPLNRTSLGLNRPGKGVKVVGGALGAVIDARGRPISLPSDAPRRREMIKKWLFALGG